MSKPLTIFFPHSSEMLTDHLPHGDGLIAYSFLTTLANRGHQLHVAAQRIELKNPLPDNIHPYLISKSGTSSIQSRFQYMFQLRKLFKRLQKTEQFHLIHQLNPVFAGLSLSLLGSRLPLVLGTYAARWPNDPDAIAANSSLRKGVASIGRNLIQTIQQMQADALILSSAAAMNQVPHPDLLHAHIHTIPYGVNSSYFTPPTDAGTPERIAAEQNAPTILFVATLNHRKGIVPLVKAFALVLKSIPNCRLRIVGEGPQMTEVKETVKRFNALSSIDFLGWKTREQSRLEYQKCTVFCMPSLGEPFGMAALEAMSCGAPLVVTNTGGLGSYVPDRGSIKVPPEDIPALAHALTEVLTKPAFRVEMGRSNRQEVEEKMDWQRIVDQTETIYRSLLTHASN